MEEKRMKYHNICCECGISFTGFIKQYVCWRCINEYIKRTYSCLTQ
jgi:hypothetical protein